MLSTRVRSLAGSHRAPGRRGFGSALVGSARSSALPTTFGRGSLDAGPRHHEPDLLTGVKVGLEWSFHAALEHHRDTIAESEHFVEIARHDKHRISLIAQLH